MVHKQIIFQSNSFKLLLIILIMGHRHGEIKNYHLSKLILLMKEKKGSFNLHNQQICEVARYVITYNTI